MPETQGLADEAPHRRPQVVKGVEAQSVRHSDDVFGQDFDGIGAGAVRPTGVAEPSQVDGDHPEVGGQRIHLVLPKSTAHSQPVHQDQGVAVAPFPDSDLDIAVVVARTQLDFHEDSGG